MSDIETHAAIEVEIGWLLHYEGRPRRVLDKKVDPARPDTGERTVWLRMPVVDWVKGDATQTVYKVNEE